MPRRSVARVAFAVTLTTVSVLLVPLVGTGCSSSDLLSEEATGRTSQALEAGAPDATMTLDGTLADAPEDGAATCRRVEIVASKTYAPARSVVGEMAFSPPITFKLPSEIAVIEGNAGNHWMTLRFRKLGTDETFRCRYRGGARSSNPNNPTERAKGLKYHWEWCDNPALSEPGDGIATDLITLRVDNGSIQDPAGKTTVRFVADEAAPCAGDGTRDASVDANDAADAAPDVQDASESGAQDASLDGADATDGADAADANDEGDADTGPACSPAQCDDANPCTDDTCDLANACVHRPRAQGIECSDGDACNGLEACDGQGVCARGTDLVVDDNNACTADACDRQLGVVHTPVPAGIACADGNQCNGGETCNGAGVCITGAAPLTDDGNVCTADACDPAMGVTHTPVAVGTSCSNGNACDGSETCNAQGACTAGAAPVVDDGNPCTSDACSPMGGVTHTPVAVGTSCSNGNVCDGAEACDGAGACVAGSTPVVDDGNACTTDACSPTGGVTHTPVAAGTACSDGNACNGSETCSAQGACSAGVSPVVDDGNPCTIDACSPSGGVTHTPLAVGTSCSNGNACDGSETCNAQGACAAGAAPVVDDGNPCTSDACSPMGGVTHTPVAVGTSCSNGNACDGSETCNAQGACTAGAAPVVDDGNPCTSDACSPMGGVTHTPAAVGTSCSNGDACDGSETCNAQGACAAGAAPVVDDGNPCTSDACSPTGGVTHTPVAVGTSCSNGNACDGSETCNAQGACTAGAAPVTDDGNVCTADACDPATGVTHTPVPVGTSCYNGNACDGSETCNAQGVCTAGAAPVTDDGNPCTVDACSPSGGVTHTPTAVGTTCADSNVCNGAETCDGAGACAPGTPMVVEDGNPCTADACDAALGVVHVPLPQGTSCANGNVCDGAEVCNGAGLCAAGMAPVVDDGNPCTTDTCDAANGVLHEPALAGTSCSNANACDGAERCSAGGECTAGTPPTVDDGNRCTTDRCEAATGVSHTVIPGCDPTPTASDGNPMEDRASILGRVISSAGAPVTGYSLRVFDAPAGTTPRSDAQVTTAADGSFRIKLAEFPNDDPERAPSHQVIVRIDSANLLPATRTAFLRTGMIADVGTIKVVPRDPNVTMIGAEGGTARDSRSLIEVVIPAGVLAEPTPIRITPFAKRDELPHPLPDVTATTYAFELEPDGLTFAQPVAVRIANYRNLPTHISIPVAYLDRSTSEWIDEGEALWDGSRFVAHVSHFSPHDANISASGEWALAIKNGTSAGKSQGQCGASAFGVANGALRQEFSLPATLRHGRSYGVTLAYDSFFAGARKLPPRYNAQAPAYSAAGVSARMESTPISITATCVQAGSSADGAGQRMLYPPGCGDNNPGPGGGCQVGAKMEMPAGMGLSIAGGPKFDFRPDTNATDWLVPTWVDVSYGADGTLPESGFRVDRITVDLPPSQNPIVCGGCGLGFGSSYSSCSGYDAEAEPGPALSMVRSSFLHHHVASPYGAGWGIQGIGRLYKNAYADEAVLVDGTGHEERFAPRVEAAPIPLPGTQIATYARDEAGQVYAFDDSGLIARVIPGQSVIPVFSGLGFDGQVYAAAVTRVNGARHYVVSLHNRLVDVDAAGGLRTLKTRDVITGTAEYTKVTGLAANGKYVYYAEARDNPTIYRFDLSVPDEPPVEVTAHAGRTRLNPTARDLARVIRFAEPHGLAFGTDGNLYVADRKLHAVFAIYPGPDGLIGPDSAVYRAFGDGAGRFFPPLGMRLEGREMPINQPMQLSADNDGHIWALTVRGAVVFDVSSQQAKWAFFDGSFAESEVLEPFDWSKRMSLLAVDGQSILLQRGFAAQALHVNPHSSTEEPTRTVTFDSSKRGLLVDTIADVVEAFDAKGRLVERRTRQNDPILSVDYTDSNSWRIRRIVDAAGGETLFGYDGSKKLESIMDAAGRVTHFTVNSDGDLTSMVLPSDAGTEDTHTFEYAGHRMHSKRSPRGDLTTYEFSRFGLLSAAHRPDGKSYTQIKPANEDVESRTADGQSVNTGSYFDPNGIKHTFTIDDRGQIDREQYSADGQLFDVEQVKADILGEGGDTRRNRIGRVAFTRINGLRMGAETRYDVFGRVRSTRSTGDDLRKYSYDASGRLYREANATGDTFMEHTYDANGRLVRRFEPTGPSSSTVRWEEKWTWNGSGLVDTHTAHGVTTTFAYDANGNLQTTSDTLGQTSGFLRQNLAGLVTQASDGVTFSTFAYDVQNRMRASADALGNTTTYDFTQMPCGCRTEDRVTKMHTPDLPADKSWAMEYGAGGRITKVIDPEGKSSTYDYNPLTGDLAQITDAKNHSVTMGYDALGRLVATTDPVGRRRVRTHPVVTAGGLTGPGLLVGAAGGPIRTGLADTLGDGEFQLGSSVYDTAQGATRGLERVSVYRDATFEVSYAHDYDGYDRASRRVLRSTPVASTDFASALANTGALSFDSAQYASPLHLGISGGSNWEESSQAATLHRNSEWDVVEANGLSQSAGSASYAYEREPSGRLQRLSTTYLGAGINITPLSTSYTYLPNGRIRTITNVNGVQTIDYDVRGLVERVNVGGEGDYTYRYDVLGRNTRLTYPDGHARVQAFDTRGRMTSRCYEYRNVQGILNPTLTRCYTATYDDVGNPSRFEDPEGVDVVAVDELDRLTSVTRGANGVETYTYNAIGALRTNGDQALDDQRDTVSGTGKVGAAVPAALDGAPVRMDAAGRVTSLRGVSIGYNARGRVTSVSRGAGTESYTYDAELRRISRMSSSSPATDEWYLYEGPNVSAVLGANRQVRDTFLYDGVDHPLRMTRKVAINGVPTTTTAYYELDLAGNVRRLRGPSGTDLGGYRYSAFGKTIDDSATATLDQPLRWKGRWYVDVAGGLYDVRARWWSPDLAVFTNIDEFAFFDGRSTLWGWPGQNPTRWSDPAGRDGIPVDLMAVTKSGVLGAGLQGYANGIQSRADGISMLSNAGTVNEGLAKIQQAGCALITAGALTIAGAVTDIAFEAIAGANMGGLAVFGGAAEARGAAAGGGKSIALGLSSTMNHAEGLLGRFALHVGAITHENWVAQGLAKAGPFEAKFLQAAENASTIKFNLSGIKGISNGVPNIGLSGLRVTSGEVTMAELAHVLRTPELLEKTEFFLNGAEAVAPILLR